jgi:amino acid transporter
MSFWKHIRRRKNLASLSLEPGADALSMRRVLGVRDLTSMGIAAIIGAGIFGTIGKAAHDGGPAIILLFIFTGITCGLSALSYARFASIAPVSGSAYTYAYLSFGELLAWIIGWDLLLEYAIGNIAVAISWSDYFTGLFQGNSWFTIPSWMTMDYLSAKRAFDAGLTGTDAYAAYTQAPQFMGVHLVADIPALLIVFLVTWLCYVGIHETRRAGNLMVVLKLAVIALVVVVGAFFVNTENWIPFAPNHFGGIMSGVSAVFFAYIGFDALSTTAEECKNPQRDLPRGMFYSLLICTVLYILITLVLTGMVPYHKLNVGDPLAFVFSEAGLNGMKGIIAVSALIAMTSVLLVFQLGQPRIWMSMSRDGLLPKIFSRLHPRYHTPGFSTIVTGFLVAIPALFMNLTEVTDLTSIGTLFAFVLVNAGVILMDRKTDAPKSGFRIPYIPGWWALLPLCMTLLSLAMVYPERAMESCGLGPQTHWLVLMPRMLLLATLLLLTISSFFTRISLIPSLGLLSCLYLMAELSAQNWERFFIWLGLGLAIYFIYGYRNSKLRPQGI